MPNFLTPAQRHRCMLHIRSKATKTVILTRNYTTFSLKSLYNSLTSSKTHQNTLKPAESIQNPLRQIKMLYLCTRERQQSNRNNNDEIITIKHIIFNKTLCHGKKHQKK